MTTPYRNILEGDASVGNLLKARLGLPKIKGVAEAPRSATEGPPGAAAAAAAEDVYQPRRDEKGHEPGPYQGCQSAL